MKKKELSFRHQLVSFMPYKLLVFLIKLGVFHKFVENTVKEDDKRFLATYFKLKERGYTERMLIEHFVSNAFYYDMTPEGANYWERVRMKVHERVH